MAINSILPHSNLLPFIHFFQNKQKLFFIVSFSKFYNFSKEFMAQRTGEKKLVAAKNTVIFAQKLCKLCIIKRGQNETFVFMQNKRSFPAKMAIFLAATTFFFTNSLGHDLYGKTIKFEKTNYKNSFCLYVKKI